MTTRRSFLAGAAALGAGIAGLPSGPQADAAPAPAPAPATAAPMRPASPSVGRATPAAGPVDPLTPLWRAWRAIHVSSRGRVIDRPQDNVSHSEGQGYALLVAEALGDRAAFDLILDWTLANLQVREEDALLAWRWHPADGGGATDLNNASDGDLFAAWALVRASRTFGEERYLDLAAAIAADLAARCLRPWPGQSEGLLLLPGAEGFESEAGIVVNPAYYMTRALAELGEATGTPALIAAAADGNALLARLTREGLPPDWIMVTPSGFAPAEGKSSDFGYEAMRVPLYLIWSAMSGHSAVARAREAYLAFFAEETDLAPTVIDAATGAAIETSADPGYRALAALAICAGGRGTAGVMPAFAAGQPYYPGILHLMSLLAQRETSLGCYLK